MQENPDLLDYFPDYKKSQQPEKEFMFAVLSTLMPDEVRTLIASCLKERAPVSQDEKADMIEVTKELNNEIIRLYSMKSKVVLLQHATLFIATKGSANYLLKKSSVLNAPRKNQKKYQADLSQIVGYKPNINQDGEENEGEGGNDMQ